jgi:two-component system, cell cycle response regulator DivK
VSNNPISVLLIDDDPDTQNMVHLIMQNYDYPFEAVDNAAQAVSYLQSHAPDVILLDIYLPDRNGYDTLKAIKQIPLQNASKIVAVTAFYTTETEQNMRERGFDGFLTKPLSVTQLVPYLHELLETA